MALLETILLWTFVGGVLGITGGVLLLYNEKLTKRISIHLVSFAAGALLANVFLDLLPELIEFQIATESIFAWSLGGVLLFFVIERLLVWHHHHLGEEKHEEHAFTKLLVIGDSVHNFIDGMIIAASFIVDINLGIVTTIAVLAHELPQEIGDFSAMLHGGMSRMKVLFYNFFSALMAFAGAIIAYYFSGVQALLAPQLVAFAAGAFVYVAGVDLIPEVYKSRKKNIWTVIMFIVGILVIYAVGLAFPE
jgi:zinc and cadmium transporter